MFRRDTLGLTSQKIAVNVGLRRGMMAEATPVNGNEGNGCIIRLIQRLRDEHFEGSRGTSGRPLEPYGLDDR